jgi:hypothetical protein
MPLLKLACIFVNDIIGKLRFNKIEHGELSEQEFIDINDIINLDNNERMEEFNFVSIEVK